ncbi:hypothetical protein E1161_13430 [Saccharopolyspora aridisoli]|uniref:Uncharacterized protein n=1 Tax=Saccharopolyspora aridisoli TaxID=2530385 RepID=A0A4R4UK64_9PSEU|nr:hypothetical protein [Saccharopolyspora aridisoli]TDC92368.1 hypothetical protein E1161_13430 [Saccharopolyspora aridisoli]
MTHVYSPEQYARVVELWERLIGNPYTSLIEERPYKWGIDKPDRCEHLYALVFSDGEEPQDYFPVTLNLISYSDYGGTDLDAANVRALDGTPGVNVSTNGVHGENSAWIQLGELPTNGEDIETGIGWLKHLADTMDGLTDYPLINEETHSEYVLELADEAWGQFLGDDTQRDLIKLAEQNDVDIPDDLTHYGYPVEDHAEYVEYLREKSEDTIREAYYSYETNEWNCETATSVVNGCHEDTVLHVARTVLKWDV